jgi:hypothetical protein
MKGILRSVAAIAAVLVAASACTSSHSATGTAHAEAAQKPAGLSTAAKVHKILVDQGQMPPVQTAADFCLKGVLKDEKDTLVSKAIDVVDPTAGDVWDAYSLSGDLDDTVQAGRRVRRDVPVGAVPGQPDLLLRAEGDRWHPGE